MSKFITGIHPPALITEPSFWFIWHGEELLLLNDYGQLSIPEFANIDLLNVSIEQQLYLGVYDSRPCFTAAIASPPNNLPPNLSFQHIRQSHERLNDPDLFNLISRARQLLNWDKNSQFCGHCGQKNQLSADELAKICSACKALTFPQISPAMLVLIWRDDEILLARSPHFMPGIYSILAGFVEVGETLEQTVVREVQEEVGLLIKNLQYFGSQSWPFPSNLMLGFIAEYDSGEIQFDPSELEDAQWFSLNKLPELPKLISLSRHLIDRHLAMRARTKQQKI
jgi:NAD+ diphosphatase